MLNFSANELSCFSAVIARAAVSRDWSAGTETSDAGGTVQEVQCMIMGDKLYIAGNHGEHAAIASFLNAFGVCDEASFRRCMQYSHWLLNMENGVRKATTGVGYKTKLSDTEIASLGLAVWPLAVLSAAELLEAGTLLKGTAGVGANQKLGWFLRKFVGAGPLPVSPYTKAKPKDGVTLVTNSIQPAAICVINDGADVHAELKLLSFMFEQVVANKIFLGNQSVTVGGLKKTCRFCQSWIGLFDTFTQKQYRLAVNLPTLDTRAIGGGAGKRPSSDQVGPFGSYVKKLFNGLDNSACVDVSAHAADAAW